ncbi:tannase/feruloyl esterase family alpha/beta hydrolase [Peristeroidobacter agariperforans]|uniref:tannase/feruloyl esterase family alpha/beta hydrolase n=1 Tax=Peristeroidobacter agariperforans TaxID=268404 RepID=UPI001300407A|nr:tannase/feruloyl esterase family alpha/beta hydrolase [Peristeroidobacter agariperforans]
MISRIQSVTVLCGFTLAALRLSSADAAECAELKRIELPRTQITFAGVVQAGAFSPPGAANGTANYVRLPSFCRVTGTLRPTADSDIRFEVWLPIAGWNGKFVGVGNGAWAGSILHAAMIDPLSKGYATAATDGGHQGDSLDASFAAGHAEKLIDFGYRATHEMTMAAKATIAAFYGKVANRSLFASCSTGGRQGLMVAYRYPEDYDAISSMAPANPVVALMVSSLWIGSATSKDVASRISPAKFDLVHKAAVKACDADDGLEDGLISQPSRCRFDPAVLACKNADAPDCLTAPQIAALHAIYKGPRNPRTGESIFPGFERGSEALLPIQASGTGLFPAVSSYFRDLLFNDPNWDFRTFDYDKDVTRALRAHGDALDVPAKGLDRYLASGRKLLLSHGWADPLVPPMASVNFYKELGGNKARSARLFMIPGMGHCGGGDGPFVFDPIATIDNWVETGHAPEHIVVSNPPDTPERTRLVCAFPNVATQSGSGSTDNEKSFRCER